MTGPLGLYGAGALLLRLANEGVGVALALLALQRAGSAVVSGALVAALLIPQVVAAPAIGLLVDRARRPGRVIAVAALLFGATVALAAQWLGRVPLWMVIV